MSNNKTKLSDFNLPRINTRELADNIRATISCGGNLLAIARRGSGKTTIAKDIIKDMRCKEVYMNLSLMERPDIGGYPNFFGAANGDKFVNFLMPSIYKDLIEGDTPCVALLDEVDKADSTLLAPLLEFVQFRSVNGFNLKNLKATIMTGNLLLEGGTRPPLPLLDRTEKFLVEINKEHWLDWAATSGEIHPSVSAYIADNGTDLTGEVEPGIDSYADTSPRGWHNASKLLFFGEKHNWHPKMMVHKVSACVGKQIGIKYEAFFNHYQVLLPTVEKIMKGIAVHKEFEQFEGTKKMVTCMFLCSRFAQLLDGISPPPNGNIKNFPDSVYPVSKNVATFLTNVDPEMSLISIRGQIGKQRALDFGLFDDKNWTALFKEFIDKVGR